MGQTLPWSPQMAPTQPTLWFRTCSLHTCERVNFCGVKPPGLGYIVEAALRNQCESSGTFRQKGGFQGEAKFGSERRDDEWILNRKSGEEKRRDKYLQNRGGVVEAWARVAQGSCGWWVSAVWVGRMGHIVCRHPRKGTRRSFQSGKRMLAGIYRLSAVCLFLIYLLFLLMLLAISCWKIFSLMSGLPAYIFYSCSCGELVN